MELITALAYASVPAALLAVSGGLAYAYNRLRREHQRDSIEHAALLEVLEGSNDALFVLNFVNGRIYRANRQACELLGYSLEELLKRTVFDLHPQELLQLSATRMADAWEQNGLIFSDIPMRRADGTVVPVECSTKVTSYQGHPAIILFARDITERLALEQRLAEQNAVVKRQNEDLISSIRYAQRIQRAVLPEPARLEELFPQSFVMHRPRDIVSGDMAWFGERNGLVWVIAADCTGHGVPGALLTLIGASIFQEQVHERQVATPGELLDGARQTMADMLLGDDEEERALDGMNAAVLCFDRDRNTLLYAGAFGPLYLLRDGIVHEFKGDRMPVGHMDQGVRPFTTERIELKTGDRTFIFSDGLADQFGGPAGKRLKSAGFKQWLCASAHLSMEEQGQYLSDHFRLWKGTEAQIDDVLVIGVEIDQRA
jgi:PAS domain S-box-containing protein